MLYWPFIAGGATIIIFLLVVTVCCIVRKHNGKYINSEYILIINCLHA